MKNQYYEVLHSALESDLNNIRQSEGSNIQQAEQSIIIVRDCLQQLRDYIIKNPFLDEKEEIYFFKHIKPPIYGRMIYYRRLLRIEARKPVGSNKILRKYLESELEELEKVYREHQSIYQYFRRGATHLDRLYFTRSKEGLHLHGEVPCLCFDPLFHTSHDCIIGELHAYEMLSAYLARELKAMKHKPVPAAVTGTKKKKIVWTGSKADAVEFLYALQRTNAVNNGQVTVKDLTDFFGEMFDIDLSQHNRTHYENKMRKKDRNPFLHRLWKAGEERMDEADERDDR